MTLRELDEKCSNTDLWIKVDGRWRKVTRQILEQYGDYEVNNFEVDFYNEALLVRLKMPNEKVLELEM